MELSRRYDPTEVEEKLCRFWAEGGFFHADVDLAQEKRFSMVIPPPNITSAMHIGNALQYTLHDVIVRYKRMDGYVTCWFPGMDHAGIATQNVVERELAKKGITRHDLGREEFVKRVWEWKERYGGHIQEQMRALGTSPDWRRERFTLDEGLSRAVREVFVRLYGENKIYRGERMINWCPRCQTALSDIEVIHYEEPGNLYTIRYPLTEPGEAVEIATTRPETMLGDTGIAVNPNDPVHARLIGKTAILPLLGRELPIVASEEINPLFGTGILKVTPGHDPVDFEIGRQHHLPSINILNSDGTLNENAASYAGLTVSEARKRIVKALQEAGLLVKVKPYPHSVGHCQRCDTPVEPLISKQWFVRMKELAAPAIAAVDSDKVQFIPKRWENVYFEWMENIKDWCISRQLWWGHQIPVWYCQSCEETIVSREDPTCCPRCESKKLAQDPDVLDTWFSSALFPFSVMGWPEKTPELEYFYPTSLLITGFDIIFFWVARMIMMGIHFVGKVPFRQVYITPLVEDEHGIKMSSSRGNTIDPLEVKKIYGMDALRFTLAQSSSKGRGMRLEVRDIEASRNFLNKIWNMARFVLLNLDDERPQLPESVNELEDRFLLSRLAETIQLVRNNIESYNFNLASEELYSFIWHDFCDWYLELAKVRLMSREDYAVKAVLYHVLRTVVKLLHPFVPFISEEIWHVLGEKPSSVSITSFPKATARDENAEAEMSVFKELVNAARMIRSELNVPQKASIEVLIRTDSAKVMDLVNQKTRALRSLVSARAVRISDDLVPPAGAARKVLSVAEVFIPLKGLIDVDAERARLSKELTQMLARLKKVERNLTNETFLKRAPEAVITKERAKRDEFSSRLSRLRENLAAIEP